MGRSRSCFSGSYTVLNQFPMSLNARCSGMMALQPSPAKAFYGLSRAQLQLHLQYIPERGAGSRLSLSGVLVSVSLEKYVASSNCRLYSLLYKMRGYLYLSHYSFKLHDRTQYLIALRTQYISHRKLNTNQHQSWRTTVHLSVL